MKIQFCSDLHLEFPENRKHLDANPIQPVGNILILAGDIVPFTYLGQHQDFFSYLSDNFETTYWIPGNHEYYHSDASIRNGSFIENIRNNVYLLNNQIIMLNGIKLVFSTLWTEISKSNEWWIRQGLSDFHVIKYYGRHLEVANYNQFHQESKDFLISSFKPDDSSQTIIVTHHAPTLYNYPAKYKGSILNEAFAVELYDLIIDSVASHWIYGHTHSNTPDFKIGNTLLCTNQLGYLSQSENKYFECDKFISISENVS